MINISDTSIEDDIDALYFKNFHSPRMDWNDVINFIYEQAVTPSNYRQNEEERASHYAQTNYGSLKIQPDLYVVPLARDIHKFFNSVPFLMEKINNNPKINECKYYDGDYNQFQCNCGSLWHIQGLRFSLTDVVINHHQDPCDVLVWQMVGKSYWTINKKDEYVLSPGDLLYVNKNATHGIRQDGPRLTMIIDAIWQKTGYGKDLVKN